MRGVAAMKKFLAPSVIVVFVGAFGYLIVQKGNALFVSVINQINNPLNNYAKGRCNLLDECS